MSTRVAKATKPVAVKAVSAKTGKVKKSETESKSEPESKVVKSPAKSPAVRLSEEDKKADTANYIYNPNTEKYVKRDTPLGKKLVKAEETGEEIPKTMTETERLILIVQTLQNQLELEDSAIKVALKSVDKELPRGFPVAWGGKQKSARSPDHPKQPSNAYIFFTKAVRPSVVDANSGLSNTEVVSLMAKMWKDTPEEDRTEYNQLAAEDKERYEAEMEVFEREHPDQARAKSSPGRPTKATAYHKYCETNRESLKEEHPDLDGKAITKLLAEKWKDIQKDADEVAKFQALADEANEGFEERVTEYHETDSPKKLSEAEQKKADDPEHYELNKKTGRYVRKEEPKKEPEEVKTPVKKPSKSVAKPVAKAETKTETKTKPVTAKPKTKVPKTVAEGVSNDEVESPEPEESTEDFVEVEDAIEDAADDAVVASKVDDVLVE